jgi:hypothetical protein
MDKKTVLHIDLMSCLISDLANLFDESIEGMSQLDAADFKDKAGKTWALVERARAIRKEPE